LPCIDATHCAQSQSARKQREAMDGATHRQYNDKGNIYTTMSTDTKQKPKTKKTNFIKKGLNKNTNNYANMNRTSCEKQKNMIIDMHIIATIATQKKSKKLRK